MRVTVMKGTYACMYIDMSMLICAIKKKIIYEDS
jgi:hypothetical protein